MKCEFATCCFSGHRPDGLPWGYRERGIKFFLFKRKLKRVIKKAVKEGFCHFISGMAVGVDLLCAEIVLQIKKKHRRIILECALPCENQTEKWNADSKARYENILKQTDKITYVSALPYFDGCMKKRNEYMVNKSQLLIAAFGGKNGGTKQTIQYAKQTNIKIWIIKI